MDKALKKLNEEKNTINCDIDMIRHSTVLLLMMMIIADSAQTEYCTTFQCLFIRSFVCHTVTGVTSHIYKGINAMLIIRGPIKPCIF